MRTAASSLARVRRAFDRAAPAYDSAAVVAAEARAALLERLALTRLEPDLVVDLGAGTGHATRKLKDRYPRAQVLALDVSLGMLAEAARRQSLLRRFGRVCADAARLPFADGSVDLLYANLLLPWVDPEIALPEFRRVLKPQGLLTLTGLGPDTLKELRAAWAAVDPTVSMPLFIDMHDLGDALVRAGFAAPVLDVERWTLQYTEFDKLAEDLTAYGAPAFAPRAHRGALAGAYEGWRADGRLPATWEVVFAQAWGPALRPERSRGGETRVPLSAIGRRPGATP